MSLFTTQSWICFNSIGCTDVAVGVYHHIDGPVIFSKGSISSHLQENMGINCNGLKST